MTDMQTSLALLIVRSSILNLVITSLHTYDRWNEMPYMLYLCLAHSIPSPPMLMQHMHQHDQQWYDPLHIIMWPYWFIYLDLNCSSPLHRSTSTKSLLKHPATQSSASKPPTCPSLLQPVYQAKHHLDLLHLSHMTSCHVSYAINSFIIYIPVD